MPRPKSKQVKLPASTQRLQEIVEESGLTIAQFAERIGMTPSGFGGVFLRGAEVSGLQARAVELEFGISHRWILTGEGSQISQRRKLSLEEMIILEMEEFSLAVTAEGIWKRLWQIFSIQRKKALNLVGYTAESTVESSPLWEKFQHDQLISVQLEAEAKELVQNINAIDLYPLENSDEGSEFVNLVPAAYQYIWVFAFAQDLMSAWEERWAHLPEKQVESIKEWTENFWKHYVKTLNCFDAKTYGIPYAKMVFEDEGLLDFDAEHLLTADQIKSLWRGTVTVHELIQQIKKRGTERL